MNSWPVRTTRPAKTRRILPADDDGQSSFRTAGGGNGYRLRKVRPPHGGQDRAGSAPSSAAPAIPNARTSSISGKMKMAPSRPVKEEVSDTACDKCGKAMVVKRGKFGPFLGCSGYPECKNIVKIRKGTGRNRQTPGRRSDGHPLRQMRSAHGDQTGAIRPLPRAAPATPNAKIS